MAKELTWKAAGSRDPLALVDVEDVKMSCVFRFFSGIFVQFPEILCFFFKPKIRIFFKGLMIETSHDFLLTSGLNLAFCFLL